MSLLSIKHVFGIETSLRNSLIYLNESCYLYPSNRDIILNNIEFKCQYLIKYENEFDILECLSVSPNKEYLSIGLKTLDKLRIIIYNINQIGKTPEKCKSLSLKQTIRSNHLISLVFSSNSKYLVALYGAPDYLLVCWSIQRFKSIGILSLHIDLPLNLQISFNPNDSSQILITGNQLFRFYRLNNGRFYRDDQQQFRQCESMNITCHCWINQNHILLGLNNGFICTINKHGQILQQYHVTRIDESNNLFYGSLNGRSSFRTHCRSLSLINIKNRRNISKVQSTSELSSKFIFNKRSSSLIDLKQYQQQRRYSNRSLYDNTDRNEIICLLPFSRGVFVSTATGCVFMYERGENSIELTYLRRLILPSSIVNEFSPKTVQTKTRPRNLSSQSMENIFSLRSSLKHEKSIGNELIHSLALSPNEEILLAGTNQNHLYQINFSKMASRLFTKGQQHLEQISDYTKKEASIFTQALDGGHNGSIITGALCIRKPLLFTIGIDRCLKIWNLQTNNQELSHQFDNEPLLLSVHPSGIFICISFFNVVIIYGYTIDGLIRFKQFENLNIQCIEYSNQGHLLAIAYENILQFYHHNDYDQITYATVNDKKFRLIRWAHDDAFIISVDFNDVIIRWDPYTGQQLAEYRIVDFSVQDLILTSDNKLAYLLGTDNKIKEFLMMTSIRDINISFDDSIPTTLTINDKTQHLLVGSHNGSIYSIKLTQTNSISDTKHLIQINVHQGAINKMLISSNTDLIISMGEDGNVIIYNLNSYQINKESKISFREEILVKEIVLKQQNIELNHLIKHQIEITNQYENKIQIKENEYFQHLHQLDLHCQGLINQINTKLADLHQQKFHIKNEHEQQLNQFIRHEQNSIDQFIEQKNKHYQQILQRDQFIKSQISHFKQNQNQQIQLNDHLYQRNIQLIHLAFRDKLNFIKNKFFKERRDINSRIDDLEELKAAYDENSEIELTNLHEYYATKLKLIGDKIEKFENEEVLLQTRLKQLEEESTRYENQIKEFTKERNEFVNSIRQVDNDLNLAKQTFQQRHFIIQEKLKRTNEMENRRDELEKFAYVFNYKIRELTSQIGPRQYEVQALIEQFNNMDNEYQLLSQNNEKYYIKIDDYKARLRAIQKDFQKETFRIRKFNETSANIKEDLKLSSHLIDQPEQLKKIIRKIYQKDILYIHTNMNFGEMNIFDCDRQRTYFERTNQRLQRKISSDIKKEKMEEIHRIKEQINLMREISSYCLKVVQVERTLSDLDIVSTIANQINPTTSNEIIHLLKLQQGQNLIQQKQIQFNSILNKQQKRIEYLRDFISKLDQYFQQTSDQCGIQSIFNLHFNSSKDQSTIISSNSIHS